MKFLLINQFFPPDPAPTGQLLSDLASALAAQGHSVRVICARTAYADAKCIHAELSGVRVDRVPGMAFGRGAAARLASYASFVAGTIGRALSGPKSDVVLTLTTPPLLSLLGVLLKHLRGCQHFSWEMDLYPDVATALSVMRRGSMTERAIGALADFSRRRCDRVIALGPCMRDRLLARGIPSDKVSVAENWADGSLISPRALPPPQPLRVLYSGNLGLAHDTDTIAGAIARLSEALQFQFVFAGGGAGRADLESQFGFSRIRNVTFLPYQDEALMATHLGNCHVGLVTQKPSTCGTVVPSKTYALMAAGRPILFIGPSAATPARVINRHGCGWVVEPGDVDSLTGLLQLLAAQPQLIHRAGECARSAFLEHYDRPKGVARIVDILMAGQPVSVAARSAFAAD